DAREFQAFRRMQREKVDALSLRLLPIPFRQERALEEERELRLEWSVGNFADEASQAQHRGGVALVGALLRPDLYHQLCAAESFDDFVDSGNGDVVALLALVRLEA